MKMKKSHLDDISNLIFNGYLNIDIFISETFITLKSLTTEEREKIFFQFKYLSKSYNFLLILEMLSYSIKSIGGHELNQKQIKKHLLRFHPAMILFIYEKYNSLEDKVEECRKFIEYYLETNESKYYWGIFKNTSRNINLHEIKHINQFQYYWIAVNSIKDQSEEDKKNWSKIEYMTNSICAFTNPKAYQKMKGKMDVTSQMKDSNEKSLILDELEKSGEVNINEKTQSISENNSDNVFNLKRNENESEDDFSKRVNDLMRRQCSGEVIDEHDRIVREFEIKVLKSRFLKKRKEIEMYKYLKTLKNTSQIENLNTAMQNDGILHEEMSVIGDDRIVDELDEKLKKKGFIHNNISYWEIAKETIFASIPKNEREQAFNETMQLNIEDEIKAEAEVFLKNLYPDNNKGSTKIVDGELIEIGLKDDEDKLSEPLENAAQKAAKMNVIVEEKDLILEKNKKQQEKIEKAKSAIDRRNQALNIVNNNPKPDEDLDQFIINN